MFGSKYWTTLTEGSDMADNHGLDAAGGVMECSIEQRWRAETSAPAFRAPTGPPDTNQPWVRELGCSTLVH